jgi:transmembrane sensor
MHDSIQIEEIAASWLARRDGGEWTEADQAELEAWLGASTAHRVAYIRLEVAWEQARRLKAAILPSGHDCSDRQVTVLRATSEG